MTIRASKGVGFVSLTLWATLATVAIGAQGEPAPLIPPPATRFEGTPAVKIEVTEAGATRHPLSP